MEPHVRNGLLFIGGSVLAGWMAFNAFSQPADEAAPSATANFMPSENASMTSSLEDTSVPANRDYQTCLDESGGVTAVMLDCIGTELERADRVLNVEYQRRMGALPQGDKATLRQSQREWIARRDQICQTQASEEEGGTLATVIFNACLVDQTVSRTAWLRDYSDVALDQDSGNWSNTIETSFGEYVGPTGACEGEYWQMSTRDGKPTLSWMDENGSPDLASDDFYIKYDFRFDGATLSLTNGKVTTYREDNPRDGELVSDKQFPMRKTSKGILLNGELLQSCRN